LFLALWHPFALSRTGATTNYIDTASEMKGSMAIRF
jgi:hypothetical protein